MVLNAVSMGEQKVKSTGKSEDKDELNLSGEFGKKDKDSKNKNYSKNKNKEYDKKAKNIPEECINLCTQFV